MVKYDHSADRLPEAMGLKAERLREIDRDTLHHIKELIESEEEVTISRLIRFAMDNYEGMEKTYALFNVGYQMADFKLFTERVK